MENIKDIRFEPIERIAMDGKKWWVVWDLKNDCYSTCPLFGRYRLKKDCQFKNGSIIVNEPTKMNIKNKIEK